MSKTYTVTIQKSDAGRLTVTNVQQMVRVNQHRTDAKRIANTAFGFASETDAQTMTMTKRASRKAR
jgi:hypothetical protein